MTRRNQNTLIASQVQPTRAKNVGAGMEKVIVVQTPKKPKKQTVKAVVKRAITTSLAGSHGAASASASVMRNISSKLPVGNSIAASLMLPHLYPARRVASQYTSAPTAVASPFYLEQADWSLGTLTASPPVNNGQYFMAVSRNPLCAFVRQFVNHENEAYKYDGRFFEVGQTGLSEYQEVVLSGATTTNIFDIHPSIFEAQTDTNPFTPHGDTYYCVDACDRKGFFLNGTGAAPTVVSVTYEPIGNHVIAEASVIMHKWSGSLWEPVQDAILTLSDGKYVGTLGVIGYGYYSLSGVVVISDHDDNLHMHISVSYTGGGFVFGFLPLPHFDDIAASVNALRVNAVSAMLTPHPAMLYVGGQCVGMQLPAGVAWYSPLIHGDPFGSLAEDSTAVTLPLKKGIFGFHKPTDPADFAMTTPVLTRDFEVIGFNNPIHPPGGWTCIVAMVNAGDSGTSWPSGSCHSTVSFGVEFRTTNVWFASLPPQHPVSAFDEALALVKDAQQWHENPLHVKDILRFLQQGAKTGLRIAPSVAKILGVLFPGMSIPATLVDAAQHIGSLL